MFRRALRAFDIFLYRVALWLCPSTFRRVYADEMVRDFAEAHDEASSSRTGAVWRLRLVMAVDIVRTIVVQWSRTGVPVIAVISLTLALTLAEAAARVARHARFKIPTNTMDAEIIGVLILTTTSVFVIAMTIVLTPWVARPAYRRRRSG
jgi:hypothetical protein